MAVSREIRSIWISDYLWQRGITSYLDSGSGHAPITEILYDDRSTISGVKEIIVGGYFWGESLKDTLFTGSFAELDENLAAGDTTITLDDAGSFAGDTADPGYIIIENEIIKYTGSTATDLTGCVRGQFYSIDNLHDGTAGTIYVYNWLRGVVQSIDYEPEDEVYSIRVALPQLITGAQGSPQTIASYLVYRFEFSKHFIDLVNYEDTEDLSTITGTVPGYA